MNSIINAQLFSAGGKKFEKYGERGKIIIPQNLAIRNFAENLLYYDKVYIVTNTFNEVQILLMLIGRNNLEFLLNENAINFIHIPFEWGYINNATQQGYPHPIINISPYETWGSEDTEKAITWTLTKLYSWNNKKIAKLIRKISKKTNLLNSKGFTDFIEKRSINNLKDQNLLKKIQIDNTKDLLNLGKDDPTITPILQVVNSNQLLAISQSYQDFDLVANDQELSLLTYDIEKEIQTKKLVKEIRNLFRVETIPVPEKLGFGNDISLETIIKIRNTNEGIEFRKWIHKNKFSGKDLTQAYVQLLKKDTPFVYRLLSLASAAAISLATKIPDIKTNMTKDIGIGLAQELIINNLFDRYIRPNPPKIFFDKLKKML